MKAFRVIYDMHMICFIERYAALRAYSMRSLYNGYVVKDSSNCESFKQRGGSYPHRSTDTRTSDPEIPRQAGTPNWHRHRRKHFCAKVNREQRVGLLFGAESEIQSLHILHMGAKCRFMLHKVRMYEGP